MTIGIYALYWEKPDLVYIGQSVDIEDRFSSHKRLMESNKHYNFKVQETYNKYGLPTLNILEKSDVTILNELEILYINEFDAINTGLNLTIGGKSLQGEVHPQSVYKNAQIEQAFLLLVERKHSQKQISEITGVGIDVISSLSIGRRHLWLKDKYPEKYYQLISTKKDQHPTGDKHKDSLYSNEQIENMFLNYLVVRNISLKEVSSITQIGYSTVTDISRGSTHKWLKDKYPVEYEKMLSNKKVRKS